MSERLLQLTASVTVALCLSLGEGAAQTELEAYRDSLKRAEETVIDQFSSGDDVKNKAEIIELFRDTIAAKQARRNDDLEALVPPDDDQVRLDFDPFVVGAGAAETTMFRDVVMLMKTDDPVDPVPAIEYGAEAWAQNYPAFTRFAPKNGFCTGVFVSDGTILTAAHCVCSLQLYSEAGRNTTMALWGFDSGSAWVDARPMTASPLDGAAAPVLYDRQFCLRLSATGRVQTADVALVHLDPIMGEQRRQEKKVNSRLSEFAWPNLYLSREIRRMTVVGYGFNELGGDGFAVKVAAEVPVVDTHCHRRNVITLVGCRLGQEIVLIDTVFGNDTCNGDSGGPAYIKYYKRYYLAGITSRGALPGGGCGAGGIYTLLTPKLQNWIRRNAKDYGSAL